MSDFREEMADKESDNLDSGDIKPDISAIIHPFSIAEQDVKPNMKMEQDQVSEIQIRASQLKGAENVAQSNKVGFLEP
jgi:hypothetical protein